MKTLSYLGLVIALISLIMMMLGHSGTHELSWKTTQISTYAARAPYDYFITTAMYLASVPLVIVSILVSRYHIIGNTIISHTVPVLLGGAVLGLIMLASYEETARTISSLKQSGYWAIRIQSFHDAGLEIFFYSLAVAVTMIGLINTCLCSRFSLRLIGVIILCSGPLSFLLMTTAWPKLIGIEGISLGVNQRGSLFVLWLAIVFILLQGILMENMSKKAISV